MDAATPSRTALSVALRRAAHQIVDAPLVFSDPLAVRILGGEHAEALRRTPVRADRPWSKALRAFLVARSRYAEDGLAVAVKRGVRQYVLLGAGLDTFAYRNSYPELRVFELDHPATQEWKRELLGKSGIAVPSSVTYVAADFERRALGEQLIEGGLDAGAPVFFGWLGVVPYLTRSAFRATVDFVAGSAPGSALVLDYGKPRATLPALEQLAHASLSARVKARGEPFELFFTPEEMAAELRGFSPMEDIGREEINARYFTVKGMPRTDGLEVRSSAARMVTAWL